MSKQTETNFVAKTEEQKDFEATIAKALPESDSLGAEIASLDSSVKDFVSRHSRKES